MTDPAALPNFPPPADEHPLRGVVLDALDDLGLPHDIDDDGDVAFTAAEQKLFVRTIEGEVTLMRVFGQWQISEPIPDDKLQQLSACNDLNLAMTVLKTAVVENNLVVTAEHLLSGRPDVKGLINLSVQIILAGVQYWHERMLGLEPGSMSRPPADPDAPSQE